MGTNNHFIETSCNVKLKIVTVVNIDNIIIVFNDYCNILVEFVGLTIARSYQLLFCLHSVASG